MEFLISAVLIIVLLVLIVLSCIVFTNAVEHLGRVFDLGDGAVGCVLAAVGTALPETIVPLVAIFGAYFAGGNVQAGSEIGVGAILGAPFLLSTLAMFVTGIAAVMFSKLKKRKHEVQIDVNSLLRDLRFFIIAYTVAVLSSFVSTQYIKYIIGIILLLYYGFYVFRTILKSCNVVCSNELEELYLFKIFNALKKFKKLSIWLQICLSIFALICFSHLFVENIKFLSEGLNISPLIISLLLAPVATELPEMFNSVIWINGSKDTLALGNITGAMVFQSCIPMSIGLFFTSWVFAQEACINIILVYFAVIVLYIFAARNKSHISPFTLIFSGLFYFIYLAYIIFQVF